MLFTHDTLCYSHTASLSTPPTSSPVHTSHTPPISPHLPHSLNIFNSRLVLADADTATDVDFERIEGVVGRMCLFV